MQTLPAPSNTVEGSPILKGEKMATVLLHSWELKPLVFDGVMAKGLVPIFFSEEPDVTKEFLQEDPENILKWHAMVMHRYAISVKVNTGHEKARLPVPIQN